MRKLLKIAIVLFIFVNVFHIGDLWNDKCSLRENLIRLHVVANSNSFKDQHVKLQVKDAVIAYLQPFMENCSSKQEAHEYIKSHLEEISSVAVKTLADNGFCENVRVSLQEEAFDVRAYDTFTLPSGVYEALRIRIGEGAGENWWCVTFPGLCIPAQTDGFSDMAVSAGFTEELANTVSNEDGYELRFYLLDAMGKLENLLFHED